jgi:LysM repeat protein
MTAQENKVEQSTESRSDSTTKTSEAMVKESEAGKVDLVSGIKKAIEILKNGGRSGITNEFGKPLLFDEGPEAAVKRTGPGDAQQGKTYLSGEIKAVKSQITGEIKIPSSVQRAGESGTWQNPAAALPDLGIGDKVDPRSLTLPDKSMADTPVDPRSLTLPDREIIDNLVGGTTNNAADFQIPEAIKEIAKSIGDREFKIPESVQDVAGTIGEIAAAIQKQTISEAINQIGGAVAEGLSRIPEAITDIVGRIDEGTAKIPETGNDVGGRINEGTAKIPETGNDVGGRIDEGTAKIPETGNDVGGRIDEGTAKIPETGNDVGGRINEDTSIPGPKRDAPTDATTARGDQPVVQMEAETITVSPDVAYRGEVINRDVDPSQRVVEPGDTLTVIARDHLGPGATPEEIRKHVTEIARVNHIENPNRIEVGQQLVLPGHTADGGFVSRDSSGAVLTRWQDGTERIENSDHTGFVRNPNPDHSGAYTEHHWGPQPQDNFEVTRTQDGRLLFADRPGEQPRELYDSPQVQQERERLQEQAESRITNPQELAQFRAHMAEFEHRAHEQGLSQEEVAKYYHEVNRLLESRGDQPVSQSERVVLAEQIMQQAAHPTSIDQGQHNTCNVTTVEARLYTRNPSEAARLVTDVATTGQFTAQDGTVVNVPPGSLGRDSEAQGNPPGYGDRSHASQIFQVTAVNLHHATTPFQYTDSAGVVHNVPAGGMRYEQVPNPVPPDTGERLYDTTTTPPTLVKNEPDLTDDGIVRVNNRLTGDTGTSVMIDHSEYVYGNASGVDTVSSEQQLNDKIAQAARDGNLPIIIGVHTGNEPLLHDSGGGEAGGSGGGHVITVTGYEAGPPARVQIDNQWGERVDYQGNRSMSVHDLYLTMRPPDNAGQIADLQRDVDWDRTHGTIDTRKEFELLRLRHDLPAGNPNRLSDADYDRLMREQITAAGDRWEQQRADGTFNEAEHDNAMQKLRDVERAQPPDRRLGWIEHMHSEGLLTDEQYDRELTRSILSAKDQWAQEDANTPPTGNAAERQRARVALERILNAIPEDRRQAILDNSQ